MKPDRPRYATKALIARMIDAAKSAGLDVRGVELSPDGTVRLYDASQVATSAYDRWKQGQSA